MKKLIVLLALVFAPLLAGASEGDALLIPDGTLYTIHHERSMDHPEAKASSMAYLVLTGRRSDAIDREIIPATLHGGAHFNPTIAYDAETGMLFAFWIHNPTGSATQLMFASRSAEGVWSDAASFGAYDDRRENLRIAVTRKYEDETGQSRNGLTVHLTWWQFTHATRAKSAQYMMVTIRDGNVVHLEPLDLGKFVEKIDAPAEEEQQQIDYRVLMQPLLVSSPRQDSVVLLFGDLETGTMNSVRVRPVTKVAVNGRLRVPGGKRESAPRNAPMMTISEGDRIEGLYGEDGSMAFYTSSQGKLRYVLLRNGTWTPQHAITLDQQVTAGAAVDALRRLVTEH
jgi:hypothetical protein